MNSIREELQLFVRRFGLLNSSCCEECCGEQLSMAQGHILYEIRRVGRPSMQQVAEELGMDVTTFSRQAKSLVAKGLIVRHVSPDDRRVNLLELTSAGKEIMVRIDSYMAERISKVFEQMSCFEQETVTRSLGLLNQALARAGEVGASPGRTVACCK